MFCTHCGAQLPEGSRFCSQCGTPVEPVTAAQPTYTAPVYPQQPVYQQPVYQQPVYQQPVGPTGAFLMEGGKMSRYNGGGAVGAITGTGELNVYDDRLEFLKTSGDQRGYALGPVLGAVIAKNNAKKNPVDVYYFQDIASVRTGKYAGMMGTLVLELRTGKSVSFVPASSKNKKIAQELCDLISRYL